VQNNDRCLNLFPCSSWFNRVWTRQELLYSKRISVVWAEMKDASCENLACLGPRFPSARGVQKNDDFYVSAEQALDFSPFARHLHQRAATDAYSTIFGPSGMSAARKSFQTRSPSALLNILPVLLTACADMASSVQPYVNTHTCMGLRDKSEEARKFIESLKENWTKLSNKVGTTTLAAVQFNFHYTAFREYIGGSNVAAFLVYHQNHYFAEVCPC
jgi:hypothetical protein